MNFYEQENNKTVLKTREIIRELPEFCNEFFLDLNQNTLHKTRMGYAYDLRVFFNFLVTENKEFLGRDIKSLTLDDLQKIKVVDINQFMDYLAYYVSDEDSQLYSNGENGKAGRSSGKSAPNLVIHVPKGTIVRELTTEKIIADISTDEEVVIARGGKGGFGNMHFATSTMQVPTYAQPGKHAQELWVNLELKVIADVGLVGFPNVGKSTFLSRVTNAQPKIANYHFTTLSPNLGVVDLEGAKGFVIADIPGLIEGASEGVGLGHEFLRHVERTKMMIHVVDAAGIEGRDPVEDIYKPSTGHCSE